MKLLSEYIRDPAGPDILVCCGSGGVGKTTISAAIGLYSALAGKKTIVLTIDPAKRLADSLGLKRFTAKIQQVPLDSLSTVKWGSRPAADLYAMMLDPKSTFDQLVKRYAAPKLRENILKNRYYQHLSGNMAGSHEYMAMEKLYEIYTQKDYDLIVLDTPPSRRALDFLEAPQKMLNILGHNLFMKMFRPYIKAGRWGLRFINIFASPVLKAISKVIGKQALEDFSGFMQLWDDVMFEGFSRRAADVKKLLAGSNTLFLAVATPQRLPMEEAVFLSEKLLNNDMPFGGFIINRVHFIPSCDGSLKTEANAIFQDPSIDEKISNDETIKKKLIDVHLNMRQMAKNDARSIEALMRKVGSKTNVLKIPLSDGDVASLDDLYKLSRMLDVKKAF